MTNLEKLRILNLPGAVARRLTFHVFLVGLGYSFFLFQTRAA